MNVDGGDERLTAHPDAPIHNGSSSFRWQNETRSNLPNLADTILGPRARGQGNPGRLSEG